MSAFLFCVFLGGGGGISSYLGPLIVALFAKGKNIFAKQKFFYQLRSNYAKLDLI